MSTAITLREVSASQPQDGSIVQNTFRLADVAKGTATVAFRASREDRSSDDAGAQHALGFGRGTGTLPGDESDEELAPRQPRRLQVVELSKSSAFEIIRQRWSGTVIEFNNDDVTARIEDLTEPTNADEVVVIPRDEFDPHEQGMIKVGALFLWHIGYRQGSDYPKERFSKLRFRRLPKWSAREIKEAERLAQQYEEFFRAHTTNTSST